MKLTEEQKDAINYDGNMVLTACPGSGKTTVIVNKVAKILSECKSYQGVCKNKSEISAGASGNRTSLQH